MDNQSSDNKEQQNTAAEDQEKQSEQTAETPVETPVEAPVEAPVETAAESPSESVEKPRAAIRREDLEPITQIPKTAPPKTKKPSRVWALIKFLLLLAILAAIGGGGYVAWQQYQKLMAETSQADQNTESLTALQAELRRQQDVSSALANELNQVQQNLEQRISVGEDRIAAQQRRLQAMSTTSREDWQLAEAEYLLKLANQRVLIEKNPSSAVALLEEADNILRELDTLDLFSLRQAVARDLAALKLADKVDVEGLYLRIDGLAQQIEALPLYATKVEEARGIAPPIGDDEEPAKRSLFGFFSSLKDYVRVVDHAEKPQVLLGPESTLYLQQNLRLVLERAQLALLREQTLIYQQSLEQAQSWITRYFPPTDKAAAFKQELALLEQQDIVSELPDIRGSLELLHNYIDDLHRLGDTQVPAEAAQ